MMQELEPGPATVVARRGNGCLPWLLVITVAGLAFGGMLAAAFCNGRPGIEPTF